MIGGARMGPARSFLLVLGLLLVFGSRSAHPAVADAAAHAERLAQARVVVAAAAAALAALEEALGEAADAGRRGSALTVAGDTPPGAALLEAADRLERIAAPEGEMAWAVDRARETAGTLASVLPDGVVVPLLDATPLELTGIAAQLRAAAAPADAFAARRHQAEASMRALTAAVAALDADAPAAALPHLDALDLLLAELRSWSDAPGTFRVKLLDDDATAQGNVVHGSKAVGEPPLMLALSVREALKEAVAAFAEDGAKVVVDVDSPLSHEALFLAVQRVKRTWGV
jgi:hypothetical protein